MRRHPYPHRLEPRADAIGDGVALGQNDRDRTRHERVRDQSRTLRNVRDQPVKLRRIGDVYDQRIVRRSALRLIYLVDCGCVESVRSQAVDRLGRECDHAAAANDLRADSDRFLSAQYHRIHPLYNDIPNLRAWQMFLRRLAPLSQNISDFFCFLSSQNAPFAKF